MLSALFALLLQGTATPALPEASPTTVEVAGPQWIRRPTGADINRLYPDAASKKAVSGRAIMTCTVTSEGTLEACRVLEESPAGEGFGDAALRMAPLFKMQKVTPQGQSVAGGTVKIPIRFSIGDQIDPLSAMLGCYGVSAAAAQKDGSNQETAGAYAFFAAQVAYREVEAKASPETFEANLPAARRAAETGPSSPGVPKLKQCLDVVAKQFK